ncbi:C-terminal processing protease CtpA/Prc [Mariniflexile fucanivorans]|uniref:C-terminal processing protease CtpA/Prc n=1 Tax=Mariniflexile fucanivorans TaxID=264023 RepID=A0A4R1RF06_9FLAO|nr:S41 family peptidase [Mariniflexile fucanivorans]TCL64476.1 C-terminal processing protease CtpA/Prc [Mariniflexile fucanivorans]
MKNLKNLAIILFISCLATSCFEDENDNQISTTEINDFVWKGMNSWYNWQSEVPNLADSKDDNSSEYQAFLNQTDNPEDFFNSLRFQYGTTDRFSWFIEDYVEQLKEFQGISISHGIRYQSVQINSNGDIIIYVRYVADNSPASSVNIKRGDIINAINGTVLNTSNFNNVVNGLYEDTVTLSFASENDGILTFLEEKTITATVIFENPVYLKKIFNDVNGKKVGYLVYNGFRTSYNDELNAAFSYFKNENINELILDLRLNGGGSVATSAYLSSMIYADANVEEFANLKFNSKHTEENGSYHFTNTLNVYDSNDNKIGTETINRLNTINNLYVLTSNSTASASEMVINGLKPYMNSVKLVGTTTEGKNVGSITLYDSPKTDYQDPSSANSSHSYAMQPIVFQISNKNGESDYTQGFAPDIEVKEYEYWNNILAFGDENEVVLKAALDDIKGVTGKISSSKKQLFAKKLELTDTSKKFEKEMYIENDYFGKE